MTRKQIQEAYTSLGRIAEIRMPIDACKEICVLMNALHSHCDQNKRTTIQLMRNYNCIKDDSGNIKCQSKDDMNAFVHEYDSFMNEEVSIDVRVKIKAELLNGVMFSPLEFASLMDFIDFE